MKRIGRSTFRKVYWGPLLGLALLFLLWTSASTALAWVFGAWLLLGRPIAYLLVPLLVSTLMCPGCGEEIDAVDIWNCGCGFHDHRERHILAGSCPACGKAAGKINCPRCACTLLLW